MHFPGNGQSAAGRPTNSSSRGGIILRRIAEYGLPDALRMTVGTEEENLAVLDALEGFHRRNGAKRQ